MKNWFGVMSVWLVTFVWFQSTAYGQERVYTIEEIPTQTVRHGTELTFLVQWEGHTAEAVELLASPEPFGPLTASPSADESMWVFAYTPNEDDTMPFRVIITATDSEGSMSHAFDIVPLSQLKPEQTTFQIETHTRPVFADTLTQVVENSPTEVEFNYVNRITRHVTIIGEDVVFDDTLDDDNHLFAYSGAEDLQQLDIVAETLIIRSPLHFPATDVHIWAREMIIEGDGGIQTTPVSLDSPPAQEREPGENGLKAGDIFLHLGAFSAPEDADVIFDLTGGDGQQGAYGSVGTGGTSVPGYTTFPMSCSNSNCEDCITDYTHPEGASVIYGGRRLGLGVGDTCYWGGDADDHVPSDGGPASPGGKPGYGGQAGDLTTNIDVASFVLQDRGLTAEARTYNGGAAGQPSHWVKFRWTCDMDCAVVTIEPFAEGTTVAGESASDPVPDPSPYQDVGGYTVAGSDYEWMHPGLLNAVLTTARADYLDSRLTDARDRMAEWSDLISTFMGDETAFTSIDETDQVEIGKSYDELQILLTQIDTGNDYFNNPAGWVPMLSFEVNASIFDQEIDHALNTLYLTHWIKVNAEQGIKALETLEATQEELKLELAEAQSKYDGAVNAIPAIQAEGAELEVQTVDLQLELMMLEEALIAKAKNDLAPPWWEVGLRTGAKTAGMICQMIPVYQPYLGSVGKGISMLSNFDEDQPWESVMDMGIGGVDIFSGCMDAKFNSAVATQQNQLKNVDPNDPLSIQIGELKKIRNTSQALSAGLTDIRSYLSNLEAPADEIADELEKLKSESDAWEDIVTDIEVLVEQRGKLVEEMSLAMRDVALLPERILQFALELDAIGKEVTRIDDAIDDRAVQYIADMEERANARLLRYHYYLAKAYEYRLLKPYTNPLDLEALRIQLEATGGVFDADFINSDNYVALKSLYQDMLSEVAEEIFADYNANRPEVSAPVRFELTPQQLDTINRGDEVTVNLMDMGLFSSSDENIRIVDITVFQTPEGSYDITTEPVDGDYGTTAYVDLRIEHDGVSYFKSNGDVYKFEHYTEGTTNPIVWGARYDPVNDIVDPIRPSAASQSLLQSLLPDVDLSELLIYSRPSAWANLKISKTENDNNHNIRLTSVKLELVYDYSQKNEDLGQIELDVRVSKTDYDESNELVSMESDFRPFFLVGTADINERKDARGRFMRFYQTSAVNSVPITAQSEYGQWHFVHWVDGNGDVLEESNTIELDLLDDQLVYAHYALDENVEPNRPPTAPVLVAPEDGADNISDSPALSWEPATDPDGDPISYFVTICDNAAFTGCEPVLVSSASASAVASTPPSATSHFSTATIALGLLLVLLAAAYFSGSMSRRRWLARAYVSLPMLCLVLWGVNCGGDSSSSDGDAAPEGSTSAVSTDDSATVETATDDTATDDTATDIPSTDSHTGDAPTTDPLSTDRSSTDDTSMDAGSREDGGTADTSSDGPSTDATSTDSNTDGPSTDGPSTDEPSTDDPSTDDPTGPDTYTPETPLTSGTTYYWRVTASDNRGGMATSETWRFTTE